MAMTNDIDSILMPPPPPRLPKRQRLESSAAYDPAVGGTAAASSVVSTGKSISHEHDSVFSRPRQQCQTNVESISHNDSLQDNQKNSVSPEDVENKIAASAGNNNNGGNVNCEASNHLMTAQPAANLFLVNGVEKRLEDAFDDMARDNSTGVIHSNVGENLHHEFQPSSKDYNPSAVSECGGKEGEFIPKSVKSPSSNRYDIPPINESFRDIIGHGQAKLRLDEALLPLALPPDLAASVLSGIRAAPASILLHGPPGCGKTKLARAVAGEAQAAFINVGPSDILSKFVGESESAVRGLFREARLRAQKMESRCTVVFFDEIDALGRSRVDEGSGGESQSGGDHSSRRVLAELLIQMTKLSNMNSEDGGESDDDEYDGYCGDDNSFACQSTMSTTSDGFSFAQARNTGEKVHSKARVIVVAATNRPEDCDPALLRRFAVRVLVGLPTKNDRKKIVKLLLKDVDHNVTSDQLDELADNTEGWSGSDLESMTREAVMAPVRECLRAAAILKKKANGDDINSTRESLLNSFRSLRPVTSKDFECGISFFLGEQQENMSLSHLSSRHAHYDSSSSSEDDSDEEEENDTAE